MIDATAPYTCIDNSIILNMADIGVYGFAVYAAIKQHMNQATGACFPSYARIAKITGMNRSTVIEYTKKLIARKLISREWRFKEDGSHTSNQFDFYTTQTGTTAHQRSSLSRPQVVPEADQSSPPAPPEQSEVNKTNIKKEEAPVSMVEKTEKQKQCLHPYTDVMRLSDGITICTRCYDLVAFPMVA